MPSKHYYFARSFVSYDNNISLFVNHFWRHCARPKTYPSTDQERINPQNCQFYTVFMAEKENLKGYVTR
jgi:hypothetical protein